MINQHKGLLRGRFKKSLDSEQIDVLPSTASNDVATIFIANPDGFKNIELEFKRHWMKEETKQQDPTFIWDNLSKPQTRTIQAMNELNEKMKVVEELELRAREYCNEKNILIQAKRVQRIASVQVTGESGNSGSSSTSAKAPFNNN